MRGSIYRRACMRRISGVEPVCQHLGQKDFTDESAAMHTDYLLSVRSYWTGAAKADHSGELN